MAKRHEYYSGFMGWSYITKGGREVLLSLGGDSGRNLGGLLCGRGESAVLPSLHDIVLEYAHILVRENTEPL